MSNGRPWPTISIVTPSFNQAAFLEETLRSVLLQGYPALEYVVLDGGSKDASVEIIQRYSPWLAHWSSAPDKGQTDAINKGFAMTRGAIFQWINSDDYLEPDALRLVGERCPDGGTLATAVRIFGEGRSEVLANSDLSFERLVDNRSIFVQPGVWLSRELAARGFPLDESLHCSFDLELMLRTSFQQRPLVYAPHLTTHFRVHPQSKTGSREAEFAADRKAILRKLGDEPAFARVAPAFGRALRHIEWIEEVDAIRAAGQPGSTARLALGMLRSPVERANRYALGAVRRELLREAKALLARVTG